jgi:methyltransferase
MNTTVLWFSAVAAAAMGFEALVSARHERVLRALGATEPSDDVYPIMRVTYPGAFIAMLAEGAWRGVYGDSLLIVGVAVFLVAKAIKYWVIATLGTRWTFRVLVPPRSSRTVRGPYRWFDHPNYIAVVLELAGTAIAMHALLSGPLAVVTFCLVLIKRVRIEEKALAGR